MKFKPLNLIFKGLFIYCRKYKTNKTKPILNFFLLFTSLFTSLLFSQETKIITGKITYLGKPVSESSIQLEFKGLKKNAISNSEGVFIFKNIETSAYEKIKLTVTNIQYKSVFKELLVTDKFDVEFLELSSEMLNEVTINSSSKQNAYKSIYKIDEKKLLKNSTTFEALKLIPSLTVTDENVLVDGKLNAIIFVDGIEYDLKEITTILSKDILKVEIINNPSARFGADFKGAVINLILKKQVEDFYKGQIQTMKGIRNIYSNYQILMWIFLIIHRVCNL